MTLSLREALIKIEELKEENAFLRRELGLIADDGVEGAVQMAFGLTVTESKVLMALYQRPGRTVHQNTMMDILYQYRADSEPCVKIIDVYICRVRAKIGKCAIKNVVGRGYMITEAGAQQIRSALK